MQLSPEDEDRLPAILDRIAGGLRSGALIAFRRITADPLAQRAAAYDTPEHRQAAIGLAARFAIPLIDEAPSSAYSWDGRALRTRSEAYVLLHEVAHWQLCPADRLGLPDFGLGAGPETGRQAEANAARRADPQTELLEEQRSSLLGILWETALGQPALNAFLEQNWLEGWERGAAAAHFTRVLEDLVRLGLATPEGLPLAATVRG